MKLKVGHNFSQFIYRFKTEIFECRAQVVLSNFSQFKKKIGVFECCFTLSKAKHMGRNISKNISPVTVEVFKWIFIHFSISQYFLRQLLRGFFTISGVNFEISDDLMIMVFINWLILLAVSENLSNFLSSLKGKSVWSQWAMITRISLVEGPALYFGFTEGPKRIQDLWSGVVVVETTVSDETALNLNWLVTKVPLLSYFVRLSI